MASKTNTDLIIELKEAVATLTVRADRAIERLDLGVIQERLSRLETKLEHVVSHQSKSKDRSWSIIVLILSAIMGSLSTLAVQWIAGALTR